MAALRYRGPDHGGEETFAEGWFGHRRLAVIDTTTSGRQPLRSERALLTYNGEVYGFQALRRELEQHYSFRSHSDSEVLLWGYQHFGLEGLLKRIDGMFAFALWDFKDGTLNLVRDPLGKKPLYLQRLSEGRLAFASSLEALLTLGSTNPALDRQGLSNYLLGGFSPTPQTLLVGITKLRPGHVLTIGVDRTETIRQYWSLPEATESGEVPLSTLSAALDRAVNRRMQADVPVGAFLSGGVDSTLVVAAMARARSRVVTLSAAFPHHKHDESQYARRVAEHFGTEHHQLDVGEDQTAHFPRFVSQLTEPIADHAAFPTWQVARLAKSFSTVVLTGDGGDELFAGYNSYIGMQLAQHLRHVPRPLLRAIGQVSVKPRVLQRLQALSTMAQDGGHFPLDPLGRKGFRGRLEAVGGLPHASLDAIRDRIWSDCSHPSWLRRAQRVDMLTVLPDAFLVKLDSATMAHAVEARSPLLDQSLLELSLGLPESQLVRGGRTKVALRSLLRSSLPASLVDRPKVGFSPPTAAWLRGSLGALAERLFSHRSCRDRGAFNAGYALQLLSAHRAGKEDHGQRLWALLVLETWCRVHLDRSLDPDTPTQACS